MPKKSNFREKLTNFVVCSYAYIGWQNLTYYLVVMRESEKTWLYCVDIQDKFVFGHLNFVCKFSKKYIAQRIFYFFLELFNLFYKHSVNIVLRKIHSNLIFSSSGSATIIFMTAFAEI